MQVIKSPIVVGEKVLKKREKFYGLVVVSGVVLLLTGLLRVILVMLLLSMMVVGIHAIFRPRSIKSKLVQAKTNFTMSMAAGGRGIPRDDSDDEVDYEGGSMRQRRTSSGAVPGRARGFLPSNSAKDK